MELGRRNMTKPCNIGMHCYYPFCKEKDHPARGRSHPLIESSITVKGQTTLPKAVRESLAVKAGDKVRYVILDEGVLLMPVRTSRLYGSLKYDGPAVSLEAMDRAIADGATEG